MIDGWPIVAFLLAHLFVVIWGGSHLYTTVQFIARDIKELNDTSKKQFDMIRKAERERDANSALINQMERRILILEKLVISPK